MKKLLLTLLTVGTMQVSFTKETEEWMTVLIHGTVGFAANVSIETIIKTKQDKIEGTSYERNVLSVREHPYLFSLQPIQELGLRPIKKRPGCVNAAYAFSDMFVEIQKLCNIDQKNNFYTFGWTGLISEKRRYKEARCLYKALKAEIAKFAQRGITLRIRLIGYSHGATMYLNCADIRCKEFPEDTFVIDECYFIGLPVQKKVTRQIRSPLFKKLYHIYSTGDKVQKLDIFSECDFFSHRTFKGCLPDKLTQIELRMTAPFRKNPCYCLPPHMRGTINQSLGHIELWFFGWTPTNYRKNLHMYPLPGAAFIPYLVCAADKFPCKNIQVDIRPDREIAFVRSQIKDICTEVPFITKTQFTDLINKALKHHPSRPEFKNTFVELQLSVDTKGYR